MLQVCGLNAALARHKIVNLLKPNNILLINKIYDTEKLKVKEQKEMFHGNMNQKEKAMIKYAKRKTLL